MRNIVLSIFLFTIVALQAYEIESGLGIGTTGFPTGEYIVNGRNNNESAGLTPYFQMLFAPINQIYYSPSSGLIGFGLDIPLGYNGSTTKQYFPAYIVGKVPILRNNLNLEFVGEFGVCFFEGMNNSEKYKKINIGSHSGIGIALNVETLVFQIIDKYDQKASRTDFSVGFRWDCTKK